MSTLTLVRTPSRTRPVRPGAVPRRVRAGGARSARREPLGWLLLIASTRVFVPVIGFTAWLVATVPPNTVTLVVRP